jgi:hypothetical protein
MLQFRDCPHCGKRIRAEALRCHRCNSSVSNLDTLTDDAEESPLHLATGGYTEEDFAYDRFIEEEFGELPRQTSRLWYWVTWLMIILLLIGALTVWN